MKHSFVVFLLFFAVSLQAHSEDILASISKDMQHFTKVATVTKENKAYQPYILSVFRGKELEKIGVSNLKEALELVPGVDMATDNFNNQTPIFRGSNPLAYGQTKLFIDGVLVNNLFFDSFSEYLNMPIEMIKRVEVVRGPGNKTDGVNAYAGSIHIITYAESFEGFESKDKIVLKRGSYNYEMGGFIKSFRVDDLKAFMDFYYQKDDKKLPSGPDGVSQGRLNIGTFTNNNLSQSSGAPVWLEDYSLGLNLVYKEFSLKARLLNHTQGSAYGINYALPRDRDRVKLPNYSLELGYDKKRDNWELDIKAGVKYDAFDSKAKLGPDGVTLIDLYKFQVLGDYNTTAVIFTNGIYGEHLAKQRTFNQSTYLKYDGLDKHYITIGYRFLQEKTVDITTKLSNRSTGDVALVDYSESMPFFDKNAKRNIKIVSLQDDFTYSDTLSFLYGFNYETTSFQDAGFEPRVSMVYKLDSANIFKAMYSRSHRNPSWQEMFTQYNLSRVGSTDLKPEKVDAFEVAYIKKFSNDSYCQGNLFYLMNKDQIYNSATDPVYKNSLDTDLYGLEVEFNSKLSVSDTIYLNYSYVDGKSNLHNGSSDIALANVAHHMAKGYYTHNFNSEISLSGIAKYVGPKTRVASDSRQKVDDYLTLDTTLYYKNHKDNYTLAVSLKNIFDERVAYPSPPKTYKDDYVQEGRNFLVTFTKEF